MQEECQQQQKKLNTQQKQLAEHNASTEKECALITQQYTEQNTRLLRAEQEWQQKYIDHDQYKAGEATRTALMQEYNALSYDPETHQHLQQQWFNLETNLKQYQEIQRQYYR